MKLFISEEEALEIYDTKKEILTVKVIDPLYLISSITSSREMYLPIKCYNANYLRKEFCYRKNRIFIYILEGAEDLAMKILEELYKD